MQYFHSRSSAVYSLIFLGVFQASRGKHKTSVERETRATKGAKKKTRPFRRASLVLASATGSPSCTICVHLCNAVHTSVTQFEHQSDHCVMVKLGGFVWVKITYLKAELGIIFFNRNFSPELFCSFFFILRDFWVDLGRFCEVPTASLFSSSLRPLREIASSTQKTKQGTKGTTKEFRWENLSKNRFFNFV